MRINVPLARARTACVGCNDMAGARSGRVGNKLLDMLPSTAPREFVRRCETAELGYGDVLVEVGSPLTHVYFSMRGFISRIAVLDGECWIDMGLIGDDGMLGALIALDVWETPMRAAVRGAGAAVR